MRRFLIALDPLFVVLFVAIGRDSHDEPSTWSGLVETAAPFLIALAVGWAIARIWLRPEAIITGAIVAATTLVLGMVLRRLVFEEGTAFGFLVVATIFLGVTIVGWRLIAVRFRGSA